MFLTQHILIILILAFINIAVVYKLTGSYLSASTFYWSSWFLLECSLNYLINADYIDGYSEENINIFFVFHSAAFLGFTLASFISKKISKNIFYKNKMHVSDLIEKKFFKKILILIFLLGLIFFIQNFNQIGFGSDFLIDARALFNENDKKQSIYEWLGTHLYNILMVFVLIIAINDVKNKTTSLKKIYFIILASSPLFLANATRTFLVSPFIFYVFGYFALLSRDINKTSPIFLLRKIFISFIPIVFIFSIMGFLRGGYGDNLDIVFTLLIWPVSTMLAMNSWLEVSISSVSTNGYLSFGWFSNFLDKLGVIDFYTEKQLFTNVVEEFKNIRNPAAVIPRSILPDLIFDFGLSGLFISMLFFSFLIQYSSLIKIKSIFHCCIVVASFNMAVNTIQTSFFTPILITFIFWGYVIDLYGKRVLKLDI